MTLLQWFKALPGRDFKRDITDTVKIYFVKNLLMTKKHFYFCGAKKSKNAPHKYTYRTETWVESFAGFGAP